MGPRYLFKDGKKEAFKEKSDCLRIERTAGNTILRLKSESGLSVLMR